jgi:hypothetical protein
LYHVGAREYDPLTARWLQRDPIDAASGDPNLYRYAGNDPVNTADPSGLDWLDDATNFFAGVGDSLTFGLTNWIRQQIGANEAVNQCSTAYIWGERTEIATEMLLSLGAYGLTKIAVKKSARVGYRALRKEAQRFVRQLRRTQQVDQGFIVHHRNPLLGHPGGRRTLFPVGGLPPRIHSGRWNLEIIDTGAHLQRHRKMERLENFLRLNTNRYTVTARLVRNECAE